MTVKHKILSSDDKTMEVLFTDTNLNLSAQKTINISDLSDKKKIAERILEHQKTFVHRVKIGAIKPPVKKESENDKKISK